MTVYQSRQRVMKEKLTPEEMAAQGNLNQERGYDNFGNKVYKTGKITADEVRKNLEKRKRPSIIDQALNKLRGKK